jgi:hypothetical protein
VGNARAAGRLSGAEDGANRVGAGNRYFFLVSFGLSAATLAAPFFGFLVSFFCALFPLAIEPPCWRLPSRCTWLVCGDPLHSLHRVVIVHGASFGSTFVGSGSRSGYTTMLYSELVAVFMFFTLTGSRKSQYRVALETRSPPEVGRCLARHCHPHAQGGSET